MAMVITVTANTAVDFIVDVEGLANKDNLQADSCVRYACGKGINAGKAVEALGLPVICLGFVGRSSMTEFTALNSRLLQTDLIPVDGATRTNITLRDLSSGRETHIRTPGFKVTGNECQLLADRLEKLVTAGDVVVLSGSLPLGAPEDFYHCLIKLCRVRHAFTVLDASGRALRAGLKGAPDLAKPNQQELEELVGHALPDTESIILAARTLLENDQQRIVVSRGEQDLVAVARRWAITLRIPVPPFNAVSHIGCGDALVAGLAVAILQDLSRHEAMRLAVACGTANLFSIEPGRIDRNHLPRLMTRIEITELSD